MYSMFRNTHLVVLRILLQNDLQCTTAISLCYRRVDFVLGIQKIKKSPRSPRAKGIIIDKRCYKNNNRSIDGKFF